MRPGQSNGEFGELADPAIDLDRPAVLLGHDVIADRQAQPRSLTGRLRREEWLKQLVLDLRGNADAVVAYPNFDRFAEISRRDLQGRLECWIAALLLAFGGRIKAISEKVQADAGNILGNEFDRGYGTVVITLQRDVEALILGTSRRDKRGLVPPRSGC